EAPAGWCNAEPGSTHGSTYSSPGHEEVVAIRFAFGLWRQIGERREECFVRSAHRVSTRRPRCQSDVLKEAVVVERGDHAVEIAGLFDHAVLEVQALHLSTFHETASPSVPIRPARTRRYANAQRTTRTSP